MKSFFNIPVLQFGFVAATAIVCVSHFGEFILWGGLISGAVALAQYGLNKPSENQADEQSPDLVDEQPETQVTDNLDSGLAAHKALTQMFDDIWDDDTETGDPPLLPVVVAVLDEPKEEETGTIADTKSSVLDAEASQEVEPMQSAPLPKDKAKAPTWGYRGRTKLLEIPSGNEIEIAMMAYRLKTVLPKSTKENRRTWSALCKQLGVQGHTAKKGVNPLLKASWLKERGCTFEDIVKASLKMSVAAS